MGLISNAKNVVGRGRRVRALRTYSICERVSATVGFGIVGYGIG